MSEVAGRLSVQVAAQSLEKHNGGKGLLIGGVPGVAPAKVVVIGGGNVGTNAAKIAVGMGAEVTILDRSIERMRELDDLFGGRVRTVYSSAGALEDEVAAADVTRYLSMLLLTKVVVLRLPKRRLMLNQLMLLMVSCITALLICRGLWRKPQAMHLITPHWVMGWL